MSLQSGWVLGAETRIKCRQQCEGGHRGYWECGVRKGKWRAVYGQVVSRDSYVGLSKNIWKVFWCIPEGKPFTSAEDMPLPELTPPYFCPTHPMTDHSAMSSQVVMGPRQWELLSVKVCEGHTDTICYIQKKLLHVASMLSLIPIYWHMDCIGSLWISNESQAWYDLQKPSWLMWWYILIIPEHETGAEGLDQEFDTSQGDTISLCRKQKWLSFL